MIQLTEEQVLAAGSASPLLNIVSAPGSGKTTVAAERFGVLRFGGGRGDRRGVLGLSFTRSASAELRQRVRRRWGERALAFPHRVDTFDGLHVSLLHDLIATGQLTWPSQVRPLVVLDDYRGCKGHRWLIRGNFRRAAVVDSRRQVVSTGVAISTPRAGIGNLSNHLSLLRQSIVSHEDVRSIVTSAIQIPEINAALQNRIATEFREVIVDEVFDGDPLDLHTVLLAAHAGVGVTLIGDPRQALYGWRGATPELVRDLLTRAPSTFIERPLTRSFRFVGAQMPALAATLRAGLPAELPATSSAEVDVALASRWRPLWEAGDNVLPLAFRNVNNATDAAINLLLDVVTRARLGQPSFARQASLLQLGLSATLTAGFQDSAFAPVLGRMRRGDPAAECLADLRSATQSLGVRRPVRLGAAAEAQRVEEVRYLSTRLTATSVIPGLTVHQAKGREWDRVGVMLTPTESSLLAAGLREIEAMDCVVYVALTRAKRACGRLGTAVELDF